MKAELLIVDGPNTGQVFPLEHATFIVGRESDCHLRPDSEMVSRHHCVFLQNEFALRIRDLGSMNGTFINGRLVEGEIPLSHGDVLSIGDLTVKVVMRPTTAAEPKTSGNGANNIPTPPGQRTIIREGDTIPAPDKTRISPSDVNRQPISLPTKSTPATGQSSTD